ncbi:ABC transporter permease [bacterium]|nr:ABC transporter permease [bacterium]
MNRKVVEALFWKEWRETRRRWMVFLLIFHLPVFVVLGRLSLDGALRTQVFANANDFNIGKNLLDIVVVQGLFSLTVGLFLIAFHAAGIVAPELKNRQIHFLFNLPVKRSLILAIKFFFAMAASMTLYFSSLQLFNRKEFM